MSAVIEVLIAHYNGSRYIRDQIVSIQKNILPVDVSLQILVVDDGSLPEEWAKLKSLCAEWENIRLIRNPHNLGVVRTFENALSQSTANYVMLCDQDDIWLPNKIRLTLEKMLANEEDKMAMVFTDLTTVDSSLKVIQERMIDAGKAGPAQNRHSLLFQNTVTGCTAMLNRRLLDLALPFPPEIPMHDHWLAICAAYGGRLVYLSEPTIWYRQHSSNVVGQPRRSLWARAQKPWHTVIQFNRGLKKKARQTAALAQRLDKGAEQSLLTEVAGAFEERSLGHLRFLLRTRVFSANWIATSLICLLYLFPVKDPHAAQ